MKFKLPKITLSPETKTVITGAVVTGIITATMTLIEAGIEALVTAQKKLQEGEPVGETENK